METRSIAKRRKMSKLATASFEDLPQETALQILKHLEFYDNASASQVCKRWKLICEDQSIWEKINLSDREVPAKFIEKALRLGCQYLRLCGTEITKVPDPNSFSASNQLKYLSISCDNYFASHHEVLMKDLLGATQSLEKLSIRCDREYNFNFQPNIIQNCQTLTVLRINSHKSLNFETIKLIFTNCLELTEVSLADCGMPIEALSFLCNNLTSKIKKLSLFRIYAFDSEDQILEDEHVIVVTNRCPKLEELDLGGHENGISELALSAIIEKSQNLVKLKLSYTDQIPFEKLLNLGSMPHLKYLRVDVGVDRNPLQYFLDNPEEKIDTLPQKLDEWSRENPLIKALMKNLPNLKINEGPKLEIAVPDPRFLSIDWLWEILCKPTGDFYEPF